MNELALAAAALPADRNPPTVYLARLAPSARRGMRRCLDRIAGALLGTGEADAERFPWHVLGYQHAEAVRTWTTSQGWAPATVNKHLAALRGVATSAWRLGLMPAEARARICDVRSVPDDRGAPAGREVAPAELAALWGAASRRDRAALALLYGAGLRRTEAAAARAEDLDVAAGTVTVRGKGSRRRAVALGSQVLEALVAWLEERGRAPGPLLGCGPQALYEALRRLGRRAGVAGFVPHDLRRTYIGNLLDAGVDLPTVQGMAGHADPRTTARYDRRGERARRAAAERLPFPGSVPPSP